MSSMEEIRLEFYHRQFRDSLVKTPHGPKDTLPLLQKVAARLSEIKRISPCEITDEDIGGMFDEFVNLRNDSPLEPDLISCLFATVYKLLEIKYKFKRYRRCTYENGWPGGHHYKSTIVVLSCLNRPIEISILRNNQAFYVCMSVLNEKYKYCVRLIPESAVPTYCIENKKTDLEKIVSIDTTISDMYQKFCLKVISNKFRSTEKSCSHWTFSFSYHETLDKFHPPKRRKIDTESADEPIMCGIYRTLHKVLTENTDCKPSPKARFFGVVHRCLGQLVCPCTSNIPFEYNWPGGPCYDSEVIEYVFNGCPLNVSVLANDEEYFLCISCCDNKSKYRVKKILKALAPTFDPKNLHSDQKKISVITIWVMSFLYEFVFKVAQKRYRSNPPSRNLNRVPSVAK